MELPFYSNGLLPAAPVNHGYKNIWIRDNWYAGVCSPEQERLHIWNGLIWLLEKHKSKLEWHSCHKPEHWWQFIHIRYSPDGNEINEGWLHTQWDAIGNWLDVTVEMNRADLAEMLVDYLDIVEYHHAPGAGAWEDMHEIDAYSLASCISALKKAKNLLPQKAEKIEAMIQRGFNSLYSLLPRATRNRQVCLSLLGVIWPFDVAGSHRQSIIDAVCNNLMRKPFGFIRYLGDTYSGHDFSRGHNREVPWILGDAFMCKIEPDNPFWRNRIESAQSHFGCMPEAYFGENMKPNRNTPLVWAEAMFQSLNN
jgi:hypothetical protein